MTCRTIHTGTLSKHTLSTFLKMKHRRNPSSTAIISPATEEGDSSDVMFQVEETGLHASFSSSSPCPPPPQTSLSLSSGSSDTDCSSSPTPNTNKSKQSKKCQRISRSTLSLTSSLPSSIKATQSTVNILASQLQSSQSATSSNTTLKVLDALAKFQTCLFVLSNTVVRLHESLRQIIPGASLQSPLSSTMPGTSAAIRPLSRRNSSGEISLDNNNILKGIITASPEMGVNSREGMWTLGGRIKKNPHLISKFKISGRPETVVSVPPACREAQGGTNHSIDDHEHECHVSKKRRKLEARQRSSLARVATKLVKYIGLLLALFASVCMSLVTLVVKFMDGYSPVSKVIWRLQGVLLPSLFIVLYVKYYQKKPLILWGENTAMRNWKWKILVLLVARGLVGSSADIFQYYSLKYLPLADSTVISFSTPIFVCIVAHFVLGEKCGVVPIFTSLLTLCGVIVISKPPILTGEEEMNNTVLVRNKFKIWIVMVFNFSSLKMCAFFSWETFWQFCA